MTPIKTFGDITNTNQVFWLDANILFTAFSAYSHNPYKTEVVSLLNKLANNAIFVTSTETGTEVISGLRTSLLRPYYNRGFKGKQAIAAYPQLYQDLKRITEQIMKDFEALPSTYEPYCGHADLTLLEMQFSAEANIGNMDARQVIAANSCDVTNFITTDKDLAQFNDLNFNVYLPIQAYNECKNTILTAPVLSIPCWNQEKT